MRIAAVMLLLCLPVAAQFAREKADCRKKFAKFVLITSFSDHTDEELIGFIERVHACNKFIPGSSDVLNVAIRVTWERSARAAREPLMKYVEKKEARVDEMRKLGLEADNDYREAVAKHNLTIANTTRWWMSSTAC